MSCPSCGADVVFEAQPDSHPDQLCLCLQCGEFCALDAALNPRPLTAAEQEQAAMDANVAAVAKAWRKRDAVHPHNRRRRGRRHG